jgi:hypothetical protein
MLVAVNPTAKQRETDWICVCPSCQSERVVTYAQKWNLEKGNSRKECTKCRLELGLQVINKAGLEIGRNAENQAKAAKSRIGIKRPKSKQFNEYRNLFDNPAHKLEVKQKLRDIKLGLRGEATNHWEGGKTNERQRLMGQETYKQLRKQVFERGNYTCQVCITRGGSLEMDHIKEWSNYPELRFEQINCRTLCSDCHKKTDNYGSKAVKLKKAKCVK